jgi:hypothetical protein
VIALDAVALAGRIWMPARDTSIEHPLEPMSHGDGCHGGKRKACDCATVEQNFATSNHGGDARKSSTSRRRAGRWRRRRDSSGLLAHRLKSYHHAILIQVRAEEEQR